jgi:hypothetical protein
MLKFFMFPYYYKEKEHVSFLPWPYICLSMVIISSANPPA